MNQAIRLGRPNFQKNNIRKSCNPPSQTNLPCPGKLQRTPNLSRVSEISIFQAQAGDHCLSIS